MAIYKALPWQHRVLVHNHYQQIGIWPLLHTQAVVTLFHVLIKLYVSWRPVTMGVPSSKVIVIIIAGSFVVILGSIIISILMIYSGDDNTKTSTATKGRG